MAGRMAVAVPLSIMVLGENVPPAEMMSRPSRAPGCEGAKLIRSEHEELAARVAGHSFWREKSPLVVAVSATAVGPVFVICTPCVEEESSVTVTGFVKVMDAGETLTLGSVELPDALWGESVWPVSRTAWPSSSVRVAESSDGAVDEL